MTRRSVWLIFALCICLATIPATPASVASHLHAASDDEVCEALLRRMPPPSVDRAFTMRILRRDLDILAGDLALDDGQKVILESIYADYESAFAEGAAAAREQIAQLRPVSSDRALAAQQRERRQARQRMLTELREELRAMEEAGDLTVERRQQIIEESLAKFEASHGSGAVQQMSAEDARTQVVAFIRELNEATAQWQQKHDTLEQLFFDNVQAILTTDQLQRWDETMRRLRRIKTINRGVLSGESVDLHAVLQESPPDPALAGEADALLAAYDIQLDAALRERNQFLDAMPMQMFDALDQCDLDAARRLLEREAALRTAVRNVNDRFAAQASGFFSGRDATAFEQAWGRRAYPRVYGRTRGDRLFTAAMGLDDIDPATRTAVIELYSTFSAAIRTHQDALLAAIRAHQPGRERAEFERRIAVLQGDQGTMIDDPVSAALRDRRETEQAYIGQLAELLGDERFRMLLNNEMTPQTRSSQARESAAESQQKRRELLRQFDLDGDGRLNEVEIEAMRKALAESGGG